MRVGQTLPYRIFERGGVGLEGWFTYDMRPWGGQNWPSWNAAVSPMSQGGSAVYTGTVTGLQVGYTMIQFGTRVDWTQPTNCRQARPITVLPAIVACTPSCGANQCGQADGCGGTCSAANVPAPAAPTNLQPTGTVTPVAGQVTISWSPAARATSYQLEFYPQGGSCASPGALCNTLIGTSQAVNVTPGVTNYTIRVRSVNASCNGINGNTTTFSLYTSGTFSLGGSITGNFYLDNNRTCSVASSVPLTGSGTISATVLGGGTVAGSMAGTGYTIAAPYWTPGNNVVTLRPGVNGATGAQLTCACNANGSDNLTCIRAGINSPQANVNFFLTDRLPVPAWYQVINGSIYAGATGGGTTGIRSYIPNLCTAPGCSPFLLRQNLANAANSAGIGVTGGSAFDTEETGGNSRARLTNRSPSTTGAIGTTMVKREDYSYFARLYDVISTDAASFNDFDGSPGRSPAGNATKPSLAPRSGKAGYITSGDLTISQPWQVTSGQRIVIFVPGNLYINDPGGIRTLIKVSQGGFLAFIVQGNIVIGDTVGYPSPYNQTDPNIEGVFIANGSIDTSPNGAGPALKLVGAGNFVAWNGFNFQRNLGLLSGLNETIAAEAFYARPDFVRNVPFQMTSSSSIWQEVN